MASSNLNMLSKTAKGPQGDECYTPLEAILPLIPFLNYRYRYYECTSNISGNIIEVLENNWFYVRGSSGRDFLKDPIPEDTEVIITNPPWSKKDEFLQRAYELGKPFAFLLPITALQGKRRGKLFDKYGLELLVLDERIDFTGGGAPHFGVAWFCRGILPDKLIFR